MNPSLFIHLSSFSSFNHHHQTKNHHKQNCNRATLRSFSVKKIVVRMKNVKFRGSRGKKTNFRGKILRSIPRFKTAEKTQIPRTTRNSAPRENLWALHMTLWSNSISACCDHRRCCSLVHYIMTCNYIHVAYNLEPITLPRKNDKNFISNITIRGLLVTSDISVRIHPSEQKIKHNFQFHV